MVLGRKRKAHSRHGRNVPSSAGPFNSGPGEGKKGLDFWSSKWGDIGTKKRPEMPQTYGERTKKKKGRALEKGGGKQKKRRAGAKKVFTKGARVPVAEGRGVCRGKGGTPGRGGVVL